jgi:CTP:molybdopterin cytidylyltransferase MocA
VIVGLLLAAGGATRFGSQKLVAPFRGEPLVRRAAVLLRSVTDETIAVVGNDAAAVRGALEGSGLALVENSEWREGLSSSLRAGVAALPAHAEAVIVALGDQPELDVDLVRALVETWRATGMAIVTARYRGVRAPPVLIAREMFGEVAELRGDYGAKALMDRVPSRVGHVDVDSEIPKDVDTPEDLRRHE